MVSISEELVLEGHDDIPAIVQYTVQNGKMSMVVLNYGATVISILAPDRNGNAEEITLSYRSYADLSQPEHFGPYYGAIVGRVANRIKDGTFDLNGKTYHLAKNNGPNSLHGGRIGFDRKVFSTRTYIAEDGGDRGSSASLEFSYISPDGEEGYPGSLKVVVTYTLTSENTIEMTYHACIVNDGSDCAGVVESSPSQPQPISTPVNLTNHTYFNLSGNLRSKILDHNLHLSCSAYTPYDEHCIPLGQITPVYNTPFDFQSSAAGVRLGERIPLIDGGGRPGLDHNWVVDDPIEPRGLEARETLDDVAASPLTLTLRPVAVLSEPVSGRVLTVHASQPGVQVYTNNWASEDPAAYPHTQHNGICLETQHFPNSCNEPTFPSGSIIKSGETYLHKAIFSFSVVP
jgi:aldose 1-epimerase